MIEVLDDVLKKKNLEPALYTELTFPTWKLDEEMLLYESCHYFEARHCPSGAPRAVVSDGPFTAPRGRAVSKKCLPYTKKLISFWTATTSRCGVAQNRARRS